MYLSIVWFVFQVLPFLLSFSIFSVLDCGNHRGYKVDSNAKKELGSVELSRGESLLSCRKKCQASYPSFHFYEHSKGEQALCKCMTLTDGSEQLKMKKDDDYSFGYPDSCGMSI